MRAAQTRTDTTTRGNRMEVDKEKSAQLEQELEQYCDKIVSDYLNLGVAINETFSSLRRKSGGNYSV